MAVTINSADSALKTYYLDAVKAQLNASSPFFAKIKSSEEYVSGKDVKKIVTYGINGGVGAGTEDGNLPASTGNNYSHLTSTLKNLYGTIEISDKAVRASENNAGAIVNLLNAEMEGLIKGSVYNLSRMLFGNGTGVLARVSDMQSGLFFLNDVSNLAEGMVIDFVNKNTGEALEGATGRRILLIDRTENIIKISGANLTSSTVPVGSLVAVQGSYGKEITGLGAIFDTENVPTLYGLDRAVNTFLTPYVKTSAGALTEDMIQEAIDTVEKNTGNPINFILCSFDVRRALQKLLSANKRVVDTTELAGGYNAITYNGIPVVADRFCPSGTMYLLNTDDFTMHQLCDWQWLLSDQGNVLSQVAGKPVYTATLVKYAELMCDRPCGQAMISGITAPATSDANTGTTTE